MTVPQVAFLAAGLTDHQRTLAAMNIPIRSDASLESTEALWNERLREIAIMAVPGSVHIGELQIGSTAIIAMVRYEVEVDVTESTP